jgi:hypothetical protein
VIIRIVAPVVGSTKGSVGSKTTCHILKLASWHLPFKPTAALNDANKFETELSGHTARALLFFMKLTLSVAKFYKLKIYYLRDTKLQKKQGADACI